MNDVVIDANESRAFPLWAKFFCVIIVIAAALHSADKPIGGGDTWVAMACGKYSLSPWCVDGVGRTWQMKVLDKIGVHITKHDPFGSTSRRFVPGDHDQVGWLNQNWLTHIIFYKMKTGLGENSIVAYKLIQAVLTALIALWAARVLGAHFTLAAAAAGFGILLSRSYVDLRPNVSSILFAIIMILLLACWEKKRYRAIVWIVPVMILWSNVHGGFIYAIMIFAIMVGTHLIQTFLGKGAYYFLLLGFFMIIAVLISGMSELFEQINDHQKVIASLASSSNVENLKELVGELRLSILFGIVLIVILVGIIITSLIKYKRISKDSFVSLPPRGLLFLLGGLVTVILVPALCSPFGLENLAHPFMIATGDEGKVWRQVVEWRPIWDTAGFGNATPYIVYLSLFTMLFVVWWVLFFFKPAEPVIEKSRKRQRQKSESLPWPKINLAHLAIIAITIAMSVKSRRFIFLGGVILSPFLAMMVQEIFNMVGLLLARKKDPSAKTVPSMPRVLVGISSVVALVAGVGMSWAYLFTMNELYLLPHVDGKDYTMFRRMVGIQAQPVEAMKFVSDNKMTGVIFNEWTNGGFVAFHQEPDPKTGRPPAQVFMDGRAQAAYPLSQFRYWNYLKSVGKPNKKSKEALAKLAKQQKLNLNDPDDCDKLLKLGRKNSKLGNFVTKVTLQHPLLYSQTLERNKINVVVLDLAKPRADNLSDLLMGSRRWAMMYIDDHFGVFVDRHSKANEHLFQADLIYPSEFTEKFSSGLTLSQSSDPKRRLQGMKLMMSVETTHSIPLFYSRIYSVGSAAGQWGELQNYFSKEYHRFKEKYDRNERFGQIETLKGLSHSSQLLANIAHARKQIDEAKKYKEESKKFSRLLRDVIEAHRDGSWLW